MRLSPTDKMILELLREKELIVSVDATPAPDVVQAEIRRKLGLLESVPADKEPAAAGGTGRS